MGNLVLEAESICTDLETSIKKARCISDTIFNEFYDHTELKTEHEKAHILFGYKYARIEHDIINDYLVRLEDNINALVDIINKMTVDTKGR